MKQEGWHNTAFGEKFCHFIKEGSYRPLCGSEAIFSTSPALKKPRGMVCETCYVKLNKVAFRRRIPSEGGDKE